MIVSLHEGENQIGSPGKKGRSIKVLRNRDEGNFSNMGSTATKMKVKMLAIWNLVRACLRDTSGKYTAEIEEGAVAFEEAKEIAFQVSSRKPKQLKQLTKDRKRRRILSMKGLQVTVTELIAAMTFVVGCTSCV